MDSLIELFCDVDDFCQSFLPVWRKQLLSAGENQRQRERSLSVSEIMTILIHFHQSHYRNFKAYYIEYVLERLRPEFPGLVSYNRFVEFIPSVLVPLCVPAHTLFGNLYRHFVYRFNRSGGLQKPQNPLS
jgi:hypothetical protein